ncbi:putative quinol monooxygenase [Longitalea luteola]|uniref:putative quinol monooxygenase n=1 Tax=Longitalea luteola TaxID=2812563 RepID=UPI001A961D2F|nr:antibiotic biosynthesis monooxygenase family protein [Longitalea luteola]
MASSISTRIILVLLLILSISRTSAQQQEANQDMMVRIAEIEIFPEYLNDYKDILREEAAASVKKEAGVIAIFPMFKQGEPNQIRIVEIYANKDAYESHLRTPHFKHYKTSTQKMVKALKLVDMEPLDKLTMLEMFKKL